MPKMSISGLLCAAFVSAHLGWPLSLPPLWRFCFRGEGQGLHLQRVFSSTLVFRVKVVVVDQLPQGVEQIDP
jgi:hypothetical protein